MGLWEESSALRLSMWLVHNHSLKPLPLKIISIIKVCLSEIRRCVSLVNDGDGVVLLTDLFGGTPSNLAVAAMNGSPIELISGINLPMLICLATNRCSSSLNELVVEAKSSGRRYIHLASDMLCRLPRPNS